MKKKIYIILIISIFLIIFYNIKCVYGEQRTLEEAWKLKRPESSEYLSINSKEFKEYCPNPKDDDEMYDQYDKFIIDVLTKASEEFTLDEDEPSFAWMKVKVRKDENGNYYIGEGNNALAYPRQAGVKWFEDYNNEMTTDDVIEDWWIYVNILPSDEQRIKAVNFDDANFTAKDGLEDKSAGEVLSELATDTVRNTKTYKAIKTVGDIVDFLKNHPVETILNEVINVFRGIGDFFQSIANIFQPFKDTKAGTFTYFAEDLVEDKEKNEYTNVAISRPDEDEGEEEDEEENDDENIEILGNGKSWQKKIDIPINTSLPDEEEEKYEVFRVEFPEDTKIPLIPVDLYNMAIGDIKIFDANFLKTSEDDNSFRAVVRNIVAISVRVIIFIGVAVNLIALIWNGVNLIWGTITPEQRKRNLDGIQKFGIALLMLIGSVLIMAIGIYGSRMFFSTLKKDFREDKELPIRVNVEEAGYSFSTNITGYTRFRASVENPLLYKEKAEFVLYYLLLSILNATTAVLMMARMLVLMGLAIIGPCIAVLHALKEEGKMKQYKKWASNYMKIMSIQIILTIGCKLILDVVFS